MKHNAKTILSFHGSSNWLFGFLTSFKLMTMQPSASSSFYTELPHAAEYRLIVKNKVVAIAEPNKLLHISTTIQLIPSTKRYGASP